jgi:hypothetical protein
MRKTKFYLGKRKVEHTWGLNLNKAGSLWVVPTVLRGYFMREYQAFCDRCGIQMIDIEANVNVPNAEHSIALWSADRNGDNAILEKILKFPAERAATPEQVGTIRYCDYELERTPEMEALYNEAVAKAIKDPDTPL